MAGLSPDGGILSRIRSIRGRALLAGTLAIAVFAGANTSTGAQVATRYAIDWYVAGPSNGAAQGGSYSLTGTSGQTATGQSSGGQFSLVSGFWTIVDSVTTSAGAAFKILVPGAGISSAIN